jgi:hypothetical protein
MESGLTRVKISGSPLVQELKHASLFLAGHIIGAVSDYSIAKKSEKFKFCVPGTCDTFARKYCQIFGMILISKLKGPVSHK